MEKERLLGLQLANLFFKHDKYDYGLMGSEIGTLFKQEFSTTIASKIVEATNEKFNSLNLYLMSLPNVRRKRIKTKHDKSKMIYKYWWNVYLDPNKSALQMQYLNHNVHTDSDTQSETESDSTEEDHDRVNSEAENEEKEEPGEKEKNEETEMTNETVRTEKKEETEVDDERKMSSLQHRMLRDDPDFAEFQYLWSRVVTT